MSSNLDFRPYQTGDEIQILNLFRASYSRDLGEAVWAWRFRDNPAGPGVIDLAWDGETLAAHYAVTPVALRINGCDWLSGLSGTTMTHPAFRGQSLFPELARRTYARMTQSGMAMVWGFPNALSHRGFVRDLKWVDIYQVPTLRLSLAGQSPRSDSCESVVELADFDDRFDVLWDQVKDDYPVVVKRDRRHLHWRYVSIPGQRYRILAYVETGDVLGYVVFKRYKAEHQIVDILARTVKVGEQLVERAIRRAIEASVESLGLWLNVTHPLHHSLERMGFSASDPVTYLGALCLQPGLVDAGIYDFRNWYWTMGDSDVF